MVTLNNTIQLANKYQSIVYDEGRTSRANISELTQLDVAIEYLKTARGFKALANKASAMNRQTDFLKHLRLYYEYYYLYLSTNDESAKQLLEFADEVTATALKIKLLSEKCSIYYLQRALTLYQSVIFDPYVAVNELKPSITNKITALLQQLINLFANKNAEKSQHYHEQYTYYHKQT